MMASMVDQSRQIAAHPPVKAVAARFRGLQYVPLLLALIITAGVVVFLATHPAIHPDLLFDDVVSFVDFKTYTIPPYLSLFSFLGFALWFLGAGFCILTGLLLRLTGRSSQRVVGYLSALAVLGLVLGLDDMLRLHENLIPYYTGISENLILVAYGLYFAILLLVFSRENRAHHFWYLVTFYVLFGFSEVVDVLSPPAMQLEGNPILALIEESAKFLALVVFATYCLYFSLLEVKNILLYPLQQPKPLQYMGIDSGAPTNNAARAGHTKQ